MSVMIQMKALILSNLKDEVDPKIKQALLGLINAVDSDLDVGGYVPSTEVDQAIDNLDKALVEIDEATSNTSSEDDEEEEVDVGYKEIVTDEDEES